MGEREGGVRRKGFEGLGKWGKRVKDLGKRGMVREKGGKG